MVTGVAEPEGSKPVIRYWIQDQGLKGRAEPGSQAVHALQKWASAMAAIVLGLAILATFGKLDVKDLPDYYSRLWRWLQTEMYEM
jgi:hypothetical protein